MANTLKKILLGLTITFLTACTTSYNKPTSEVRTKLYLTPESLLQHPCKIVGPGRTVRGLGASYAANTSCAHQYYFLIEAQKEYREKMLRLHGEKDEFK